MNTKEIIDRIFKEPGIKYELTEFENLGKPIHEILTIIRKVGTTGRDAGKPKYYLKSFIPFSTGNEEVQVYSEDGRSAPEEVVRQLWVYKLMQQYSYKAEEIDLEKSVQFGTEVGTKAADIIVYNDATKITPKIIVECKRPKRKDGIEQLKSYMNAKGAPVAVWSNGADSIILYRPYPAQFDDTLFDLPKRGEEPKDVLEAKKTLLQLKKDFNFKKIIQDLEELVLADSGKDEFNEIFKLIFAKIWDEKEAQENRTDKVVEFRKALDPEITYDRINNLFHKACEEWPGIFKQGEDIELAKRHLQVCVGPIEGVRLLGSNLRIMDDAFEYLLPTEAKKKKGQFFTPRHVVEMCVRMLNPTRKEYVMDPACGSGGFLLHAMEWCYPAAGNEQRELRKHKYAAKYLWGIDFETRAAKTARALMLIAGDGHTNIFGPDVNSLDPKTWYETGSGQTLMNGLRQAKLTVKKIPENEPLTDEERAWEYFDQLNFDLVLANPPFAGEIKDRKVLMYYDLAKPALKRAGDNKQPKEERDVLFIERILKMLKPGGRAAIVLPQGKFNNSSLGFIREWILKKARLLAVIGLHANTFKPHTGTKTSVLLIQKHTQEQLEQIAKIHDDVAGACPDYRAEIEALLFAHETAEDVSEEAIPEAVADLITEIFAAPELEEPANGNDEEQTVEGGMAAFGEEDRLVDAEEKLNGLKAALLKAKQKLMDLESDAEALVQKHEQEIAAIKEHWEGKKSELNANLKPLKSDHKAALARLKDAQRARQKSIKTEIRVLEKQIPQAERELKMLNNRGKLELILADDELIGTLKERWIAAEVAKRLDYPVLMAVSELGGKDTSGDYEYVIDEDGSLVEFPDGHPREGQLVVKQDLVNYDLHPDNPDELAIASGDKQRIAEAFVSFAVENGLSFWSGPELRQPFTETEWAYTARCSEIQRSNRADAEYFSLRTRRIVQRIRNVLHVRLGDSCSVRGGFPWRSSKFREDGVGPPVVRIRNIQPYLIELDSLSTLDPAYVSQLGLTMARQGDIVVGMDGLKWFYAALLAGDCYVNQRVAHLIWKSDAEISPEYAVFIVNSSYGQAQLLRDMTIATTVGHITNRNIRNLLIPVFSREFHDDVTATLREALDRKKQSKVLLDKALAAIARQEVPL